MNTASSQISQILANELKLPIAAEQVEYLLKAYPNSYHITLDKHGKVLGFYKLLGLSARGRRSVEWLEKTGEKFVHSEMAPLDTADGGWLGEIYFKGSHLQRGLWLLAGLCEELDRHKDKIIYSRTNTEEGFKLLRHIGFEFFDSDLEIQFMFEQKLAENMLDRLMFRPRSF